MVDRAIDDKSPDTLVVVSGEGFWTGSSTLPHLHHFSGAGPSTWGRPIDVFAPPAVDREGLRVATTPIRTLSLSVTPRRLALLGLVSTSLILLVIAVAAFPYRGRLGEAYSPLNHFISELGEISVSRLAWAFNLGIVVGGMGLGTFLLLLAFRLNGPFKTPFVAVGLVAGVSGTLVGVFPMDYLSTHRIASDVFFLTGGLVAGIFSLWLLTARRPGFTRWLLAPGAEVVVVFGTFIAAYSTYHPANPDGPILNRPTGLWGVPFLEWVSLLSLLLWVACVSIDLLRQRTD